MLKKVILTLSLCFAYVMMGYATPSSVVENDNNATQIEVVTDANAEVAETPEEATVETASNKMSQAEKVENLKNNDPNGFVLTIMAMVIVVMALVIIFLLFLVFGKLSSRSQAKKKLEAKGLSSSSADLSTEEADSGEVIAAIAMALAQHFDAHDTEDTVLTIKRMKRAYSPWNSKIYNMREIPQLTKNNLK